MFISKAFTFFGSQSRLRVNLFFLGEGEPRPSVDDGKMNEGNKRIEGETEALAMAELVATKINSYLSREQLSPVDVYFIKENLKQLNDLLSQLPPTKRQVYANLIKEVEPRLLVLEAKARIERIIRFWPLQELLSPIQIDEIALNLERLRTLLPQLSSEEQEELKVKLLQLQPGEGGDIESLIATLEAQLPRLEIAVYPIISQMIDIIDYRLANKTLNPEYIDLMQRDLQKLGDLLPHLPPNKKTEILQGLLSRLQPREGESLEDLLVRLKEQLPSLKAVGYIIEINYWLLQIHLSPAAANAIIKSMITELKGLLPRLPSEEQAVSNRLIQTAETRLKLLELNFYYKMIDYWLSQELLSPEGIDKIQKNLRKIKDLLQQDSNGVVVLSEFKTELEKFENEVTMLTQEQSPSSIQALRKSFGQLIERIFCVD